MAVMRCHVAGNNLAGIASLGRRHGKLAVPPGKFPFNQARTSEPEMLIS
jgi:hypothetical protein